MIHVLQQLGRTAAFWKVPASRNPWRVCYQQNRFRSLTVLLLTFVLVSNSAILHAQVVPATPLSGQSRSAVEQPSNTPAVGGPYFGTAGVPIRFNRSAAANDADADQQYSWEFGDGSAGKGISPTHVYPVPGVYTVALSVANRDGEKQTAFNTVTVVPAHQLAATSNLGPETNDLQDLSDPRLTDRDARSVASITDTHPRTTDQSAPLRSNGQSRSTDNVSPTKIPESAKPRDRDPNAFEPIAPPYPNVPSLAALYERAPQVEIPLQRFGSNLFSSGGGNGLITGDIPVDSTYVLGTGDTVAINVWGGATRTFAPEIDHSGRILLPDVGSVMLAGQTLAQAKDLILHELQTQFKNVNADVTLARVRTIHIYVVGDVTNPGAYDISSLSTPLNPLIAAGGPTAGGSLRIMQQLRAGQVVRTIDLYDLLLHGVRGAVERMEPGDTLLVPPAGQQVAVAGLVRRPAIYELFGETNLAEVIQLAGGFLATAELNTIKIDRVQAHDFRTVVSFDAPAGQNRATFEAAMKKFPIQDNDRVIVAPILPYNQQTVFLEGHVFQPGEFPYHAGMKANELIHSYKDMLPEPSDHVEIVRLQAPDYRPMTLQYRLSDVLSASDSIVLQPFDTLRISGRYEFDPPTVSIFGSVLHPGKYPLPIGLTAAELVKMAGGFTRSAYTAVADVASYFINPTETVKTELNTFQVSRAINGDTSADIMLRPGDVVTIREKTGWQDIGASVGVQGEVAHTGTYGIERGERLSVLLRRAGGFTDAAYPNGAILQREQVRQLDEATRARLITRLEAESSNFSSATANSQQIETLQELRQEQSRAISALQSQPASGRVIVAIGPDISKWENTAADIEVANGDTLLIPKKPSFVFVGGEILNSTALSFSPGKTAGWYLNQSGGTTNLADKKQIFVIRANGSVIGRSSTAGIFFNSRVLETRLQPGDSIVVPARVLGGSLVWKNLVETAQVFSSIALAGLIAASQFP